jgi:hypothetical protein
LPIDGEVLVPTSLRTFRTALLTVVSNTHDLEMPKMANSENYVILEMYHTGNYEEFSCSTIVFNEDKLQRNTRRHQKIRRADDNDMTERERVTIQDARIFITRL